MQILPTAILIAMYVAFLPYGCERFGQVHETTTDIGQLIGPVVFMGFAWFAGWLIGRFGWTRNR